MSFTALQRPTFRRTHKIRAGKIDIFDEKEKRMIDKSMERQSKECLRIANIKAALSVHSLQHIFGALMVKQDIDIKTIKAL